MVASPRPIRSSKVVALEFTSTVGCAELAGVARRPGRVLEMVVGLLGFVAGFVCAVLTGLAVVLWGNPFTNDEFEL